jgi:bifunctional DNA-binding transcriptional regulator/antitoxin component of YhaV-PrlF toxin-antitoxin module
MQKPIIDAILTIQKMDMKGGWSYVLMPKKSPKTGQPWGWYIVRGSIDGYPIAQYKLWPTRDGQLFLPIKSQIRKSIKKEEGDDVHIILYEDHSEVVIPDEFLLCLADYPTALHFFEKLSATSQKQFVDHIYSSKNLETRGRRIAQAIEKLEQGLKWHEKVK